MKVTLSYFAGAGWQFFDNNGNPLTGGLIYTYEAGTTTPLITYTSSNGLTANSNPIVLDSAGRVSNQVWLELSTPYKFVLKTSVGVTIGTYDNLIGVGGITSAQGVVSVKDFGAGAGAADDAPFIQAAIDFVDGLGGGVVYFPVGEYLMQSQVIPKSNIVYKGEGRSSSLVWNSTSGGYFFNQASTNLENVTWDNLGFNGTINYVTNPTIYKQTYTRRNTAIRTSGIAVIDVTVKNCYFEDMSNGSIDFNGDSSNGIFVLNNTFINGCYCYKVVAVRTPSGGPVSDAARPQNILFDGNYISGGGPTGYYDASKEDWTASCDGLDVDSCKDVIITNNTVDGVASIGIRVEQTNRAKVIGNTVKETGNTGITFYNECFDGVCVGNTVQNWGRIPPAYAIRSFGGVYYAAKEFPDATLAPLPADPSVSAWFYVWPYALTGVNASTIIAYANTQYYPSANGILPYRGDAAISVTQGSQKINVVGNNVVGNISTSGGLYNYSSDYGISCIHPSNGPGGQLFAPLNSMITGNGVVDMRVYRIWHPQFADPIHYNTASYNTGDAVYSANRDSNSLIWSGNVRIAQDGQLISKVDAGSTGRSNFQANWINFPSTQVASADANTFDDYEEGTFAPSLIASTSGTVTLDFTTLAYTKVGRVVTITGEVQVNSVSSPVGDITLGNLPFPNSGLSQRASRVGMFIEAISLAGSPTGVIQGFLDGNASVISIRLVNNFAFTSPASNLQTGSSFKICFSYNTTT